MTTRLNVASHQFGTKNENESGAFTQVVARQRDGLEPLSSSLKSLRVRPEHVRIAQEAYFARQLILG